MSCYYYIELKNGTNIITSWLPFEEKENRYNIHGYTIFSPNYRDVFAKALPTGVIRDLNENRIQHLLIHANEIRLIEIFDVNLKDLYCHFTVHEKTYYVNNKIHREDGPAVIKADGTKEWRIADQLHRMDGPAIEWYSGRQDWYINGEQYSQTAFERKVSQALNSD